MNAYLLAQQMMRWGLLGMWGICLCGEPLHAQIILQGAIPPSGNISSTAASKKGTPSVESPPMERSIGDIKHQWNGLAGEIVFSQRTGALRLTRFALPGEKMTRPSQICTVEANVAEVVVSPKGIQQGVLRYEAALPECTLEIGILDGALLVTTKEEGGVCLFQTADCRVHPEGLWGPAVSSFSPTRIKQWETARLKAETNMRSLFHALLEQTKDKNKAKQMAAEQAAFSSAKANICLSYDQEEMHGFCAYQITQSRIWALSAQLSALSPSSAKTSPRQRTH